LDTSSSEGADTLEAAAYENETQNSETKKSGENKDTNSFEGDDTLKIVGTKDKNTVKKKKKTQEWTEPRRKSTMKEER
jgi:hypothetical protein